MWVGLRERLKCEKERAWGLALNPYIALEDGVKYWGPAEAGRPVWRL